MLNPMTPPELAEAEIYERSRQLEALELSNRTAAASSKPSLLKRIAGKLRSLFAATDTRPPEAASPAEGR